MQLRTIILLSATLGIFILIVLCIIITAMVTSKKIADKNEKEMKRKWFFLRNKDKKEKEETNQ